MIKSISGVALGLLLAALPALGQVAAPSILPASPGVLDPAGVRDPSFVPVNPATLSWSTPSKIGFGAVRTTRNFSAYTLGGVPVAAQSSNYDASHGGFQAVGQRFALAVEAIQIQDQSSNEKLIVSDGGGALSVQFANALAVGAGYRTSHQETAAEESDSYGASGGLSLRLGEYFYLGGAYGDEKVSRSATAAGGVPLHGTRGATVYGAGFRKGGGLRMHLEYYSAHLGNFEYKGLKTLGGSLQTGVAEFGFWNLLFGYSATAIDLSRDRITSRGEEGTIGIGGDHGLTVLLHYSRSRTHVAAYDLDIDALSRAISLAWQF